MFSFCSSCWSMYSFLHNFLVTFFLTLSPSSVMSLLTLHFFIPNVSLKSALHPICDFHLFPCWKCNLTFRCAVPIKENFWRKSIICRLFPVGKIKISGPEHCRAILAPTVDVVWTSFDYCAKIESECQRRLLTSFGTMLAKSECPRHLLTIFYTNAFD